MRFIVLDLRSSSEDAEDSSSWAGSSPTMLGAQQKAWLRTELQDYDSYGMDIEPPLRPLEKIHPETGRTTLMIGRHAHAIPGLSADESEQLLSELSQFACQPPRVYEHSWCPGDVAVWDNRALMHRACPYDMHEPRIIYNCRIAGDPETEFAAHA